MPFVPDSADQTCDKLYAHPGIGAGVEGPDAGALGVIDPQTIVLSEIAKIDSGWGELTGTGDGRLFAFEGSEQTFLVEYDKDTAHVLGKWPLPGIENPSAFAFAFWGGDFYMFTTEPDDLVNGSHVVHVDFDGSDGDPMALTLLIDEAPLRIVGAGVSAWAPPSSGGAVPPPAPRRPARAVPRDPRAPLRCGPRRRLDLRAAVIRGPRPPRRAVASRL